MPRLLLDHTITPDELTELERRNTRALEFLVFTCLAAGLALAIAVGVMAPDRDFTQTALAMLLVAAVPVVPALLAYRQHRVMLTRPLRIRAMAVELVFAISVW